MSAITDLENMMISIRDNPESPEKQRREANTIARMLESNKAEENIIENDLFNAMIIMIIAGIFIGIVVAKTSKNNISEKTITLTQGLLPQPASTEPTYLWVCLFSIIIGIWIKTFLSTNSNRSNKISLILITRKIISPKEIIKSEKGQKFIHLRTLAAEEFRKENPKFTLMISQSIKEFGKAIIENTCGHSIKTENETRSSIIAQTIIAKRTERHMTQNHLAQACDVNVRTIQRLEKTGEAGAETLAAIASVLDLTEKPNESCNEEKPTGSFRTALIVTLITGIAIKIDTIALNSTIKSELHTLSYMQVQILRSLMNVVNTSLWSIAIVTVSKSITENILIEKTEKCLKDIFITIQTVTIVGILTTVCTFSNLSHLENIISINTERNIVHQKIMNRISTASNNLDDRKKCAMLVELYSKTDLEASDSAMIKPDMLISDPTLTMADPERHDESISKLWNARHTLTTNDGPWTDIKTDQDYQKAIKTCLNMTEHD